MVLKAILLICGFVNIRSDIQIKRENLQLINNERLT